MPKKTLRLGARIKKIMNLHEFLADFLPNPPVYQAGFGSLRHLLHPRFQGYEYGIAFARRLDDRILDAVAAADGPTQEYFELYNAVNRELSEVAQRVAAALQAKGVDALAINPTPTEGLDRSPDFSATLRQRFSHKMAATRAGLGWIGKTDLFVSTQFGPRVRLATVLTAQPLTEPAEPMNESRCGACILCVERCPAQAANGRLWSIHVDRDEFYDASKCQQTANRLSLERINENIRICGICVSVCPHGKSTGDNA